MAEEKNSKSKKIKIKRKLSTLEKTDNYIKNIIALFLWTIILSNKLYNFNLYSWILINIFRINNYRLLERYRYLTLFALVILLSILFKRRINPFYIFWYLFYILSFPFILITKIVFFSMKLLKVYQFFISNILKLRYQILCFLLDLLVAITIFSTDNMVLVSFSMIILLILMIFHLIYLYKLILNPLIFFDSIFLFLDKWWSSYKIKIFHEQYFIKKEIVVNKEKIDKLKESLRKNIEVWGKAIIFIKNMINKVYSKGNLLKYFSIFFISSIILTISIFSIEYYGLTNINENSFLGLSLENYSDYFYFSFAVLSTIDSGGIFPTTIIAKVLVIIQFLIGIFLFYIFIISFSYIAAESVTTQKHTLSDKIRNEINYLNKISKNELGNSLIKILKGKK
jgi:hypothetical protein